MREEQQVLINSATSESLMAVKITAAEEDPLQDEQHSESKDTLTLLKEIIKHITHITSTYYT